MSAEELEVEVEQVQLLHDLHEQHRVASYPDLSQEEFLRKVCNEQIVLPEKKLAPVLHMPVASPVSRGRNAMGWRPCEILIVLPACLGLETMLKTALPLEEPSARFLRDELIGAGIRLEQVMVTHAVRFAHPTGAAFSQAHKNANAPYVLADIRNCRPRVVLAMGANPLKAIFGPKTKLDSRRGGVYEFEGIPVVPSVSHMGFMSGYGDIEVFRAELRRAAEIASGVRSQVQIETDYVVASTADQAEQVCNRIRQEADRFVSFDFEFGNDVANEEFNYPLTCQFGWGNGRATVILLRGENGAVIHGDADRTRIVEALRGVLLDKRYRLTGQHMRVDLEVAHKMGIDADDRLLDGFDTMLAHHAMYGDSSQGLDHLCRKYTPEFGPYWQELEDWLDANQRKHTLQFGYRDIPHRILLPYGLRDADVTHRVACLLSDELDQLPTVKRYFTQIAMPAALHLLDVQRQGILVDESRRMELRAFYQPAYDEILAKLRAKINWPDFNPGSKDQVAALLFSTTNYKDKKPAPEGVNVLRLTPTCNTDKYPKEWDEIAAAGQEDRHSPSTKAANIEALYNIHKLDELKWLKQLSAIGKFLTTYLKPKELNEFGVNKAGKGFAENIWTDGRVRTHLSQVSETGRLKSSAANLQCSPKKQESAVLDAMVDLRFGLSLKEYERRCKSKTCPVEELIPAEKRLLVHSFKSCYIPEDGNILVEADFKTAEIFVWAYSSGDPALIKLLDQGRDIHSEIAVTSFQLPDLRELPELIAQIDKGNRDPYDKWVKKFKKEQEVFRVTAKSVIFGIMYGRSAGALARLMATLGVSSDKQQCQAIIDMIAKMFPQAWGWIKQNQRLAIEQEYLETPWGSRRYFSGASHLSETEQAAIRRESSNGPIQGAVAMLALQAGINFYNFRYRTEAGRKLGYKVLLPIHDAFLFEVRRDSRDQLDKVITLCMSRHNPIPGTGRYLGVDIEHYDRWGEH
jgi:DNA polymerase I-like protein with 3'-5' exonuclease and polymerase domains